jgi:hypothetical protein
MPRLCDPMEMLIRRWRGAAPRPLTGSRNPTSASRHAQRGMSDRPVAVARRQLVSQFGHRGVEPNVVEKDEAGRYGRNIRRNDWSARRNASAAARTIAGSKQFPRKCPTGGTVQLRFTISIVTTSADDRGPAHSIPRTIDEMEPPKFAPIVRTRMHLIALPAQPGSNNNTDGPLPNGFP